MTGPLFSRTYGFEGALYRDHLGRTVVADVEGLAQVAWASGDCEAESDGTSLILFSDDPLFRAVITTRGFLGVPSGTVLEASEADGVGVLCADLDCQLFLNGSHTRCATRCVTGIVFQNGFASDVPLRFVRMPFAVNHIDSVDVCDDSSRKAHSLVVQNESARVKLESRFDRGGKIHSEHVTHLNRMRFIVDSSSDASALLLRRTYDRFHGRQRARVLVDGSEAGWWYAPAENREQRWAHDFFVLQPSGSQSVIEIDPVAGSPLWSVSRYEVFSLVPQLPQ